MKNIEKYKIPGAIGIMIIGIFVILFLALLIGSNQSPVKSTTATIEEKQEVPVSLVEYGNGVYYFPQTHTNFANALSKFLGVHTNLEVTAMTGDVVRWSGRYIVPPTGSYDKTDYGAAVGYFVTFREKK